MPRLSEFYGVSVYVYYKDHAPPHVRAFYGDDEAMIRIDNGDLIECSLPRRAKRLVEDWLELHRKAVLESWNAAVAGIAPRPIPPLR